MKKVLFTMMSAFLFAVICNAMPILPDDIEEEKETPRNKTGNQEEPCYDISSTYFGATGQLAIRFATSIAHEKYRNMQRRRNHYEPFRP